MWNLLGPGRPEEMQMGYNPFRRCEIPLSEVMLILLSAATEPEELNSGRTTDGAEMVSLDNNL